MIKYLFKDQIILNSPSFLSSQHFNSPQINISELANRRLKEIHKAVVEPFGSIGTLFSNLPPGLPINATKNIP